mmetsp:Transcript_32216/g.76522  ORF Transcript_32216/g.76522 Transcript_32216/m.76522 type:complete len:275 (+) Transcript_32216:117-941(+)
MRVPPGVSRESFMLSTDWTVPKERRPASEMLPPLSLALKKARVNVATRHAVNVRHTSAGDQCEDASSRTKRSPPTGAPNAAAMPAPAPAQINSRRSRSLCMRSRTPSGPLAFPPFASTFFLPHENISRKRFCPRVSPEATPAPMWIMGASWPHAIALDTERIVPITLTAMQRRRRKLRTWVPLRYALISGIPPAAAPGSKYTVMRAPATTRSVLYVTKKMNAYASGASESRSSWRISLRVEAKISTPTAMTLARHATKNPMRIAMSHRTNVSPE